jgi:Tfp pilus assembly protein PilN
MKRLGQEPRLAVGGVPRVNLLPVELRLQRHIRQVHRLLGSAVVAACLIAGLGTGLGFLAVAQSDGALRAAQRESSTLVAEQGSYGEVTAVRRRLTTSTVAAQKASRGVVRWSEYLRQMSSRLPSGLTIGAVAVESAPASGAADRSAFVGAHVATATVHVLTSRLSRVRVWLARLGTLRGYVDASPGSVSTAAAGQLDVVVTVHLSDKAYSAPPAADMQNVDSTTSGAAPAAQDGGTR